MKMFFKYLAWFTVFHFFSTSLIAQKESNRWYFGKNAGLDFNTSPPTVLTDGKINTREGVASISDKTTGKILFYTEGTTVWDATHNVMPNGNGLLGDYSSTQSSIVIPDPGNSQKYYIFTTALDNGFQYTRVDMTLNGGKGDVVTTSKNVLLLPGSSSSEKVIAIQHCNKKDYWVITHTIYNSYFYVYLVTAAGVQPPIIYNQGSSLGGSTGWNAVGYLKLSPSGTKLAHAIGPPNSGGIGMVELLNFNITTGILSGPVTQFGFSNFPYGLEFSPNEKYLYVADVEGRTLVQYDITSANINASAVTLASSPTLKYGALQLGPDGKIYVSIENGYNIGYDYLSLIKNPDIKGTGSNYTPDAVYLNGKQTLIGLPTFLASYLKDTSGFSISGNCVSSNIDFKIIYSGNIDSVKWNFGDGSPVSKQLSTQHVYNIAGTYNAELISFRACNISDTTKKQVIITSSSNTVNAASICSGSNYTLPNGTIVNQAGDYTISYPSALGCDSIVTTKLNVLPSPVINLGKDTAICTSTALQLNAGSGFSAYLWNDGTTSPSHPASSSGLYWAEVQSANGCKKRDTINITVSPVPSINLGKDTSICGSTPVQLNAGSGFSSYLWNDGSTNQSFQATTSGIYWAEVQSLAGCKKRDSVSITIGAPPFFSLGKDTSICNSSSLQLNAGNGFSSYLWNDGSTGQLHQVSSPGIYWAEVQSSAGCKNRDSINISVNPSPSFSLGNDTSICGVTTIQLNAGNGFSSYLWSDGSTNQFRQVSTSGIYWAEVQSLNGCKKRDSVTISIGASPSFSLGNDTAICNNSQVQLNAGSGFSSYLWNDGSSGQLHQASTSGIYWAEVQSSNGCSKRDSIQISLATSPSFTLGKDSAICKDQNITLGANPPGVNTYLWNTGLTTPQIVINKPGIYWLQVQSSSGCKAIDTIQIAYNATADFTLGPDSAICSDRSMTLGKLLGGATYLWNTGSTNPQISITNPGQYSVAVNQAGCTARDTIVINSAPVPVVKALSSNEINCTISYSQLTAVGAANYVWTPSIGLSNANINNPVSKITSTTTFVVQGTDVNGCVGEDSVTVSVKFDGNTAAYKLPNAFSPNGDGRNDCFGLSQWGPLENLQFSIYNRWGQKVFSTTNASNCWDGTIKGKRQDPGAFVYIIKANTLCGDIARKGIIMLIR